MKRLPLLFLPALLLTQIACIWDRDTLASELAGRGDAIKIIAGIGIMLASVLIVALLVSILIRSRRASS